LGSKVLKNVYVSERYFWTQCNSYKFSLAWSRILPKGDLSVVNEKGIAYYNGLIDALLANGIEPIVVMWHFDLPAELKLSWEDEELIEHFVNYSRVCYDNFGDRVKLWITLNEPWI
jgi:beta-glucosidase/6-phospho-beta-glucosidase/beta-galactosidase